MSGISLIPSNTISPDELALLRGNSFELHCLEMKLQPMDSRGREFSGPGVIQQTASGQLHFTLYSQSKISGIGFFEEFMESINAPLGRFIPDESYYRLIAVDFSGRRWIADRILPDNDYGQVGTLCKGKLGEIVCTSEHKGKANDRLYLEIFSDVTLPYNEVTTKNETVAGRNQFSSSLNTLHFEANGIEFLLQKQADSLVVMADSLNEPFTEDFELRVLEALQFVLARPLLWSVIVKLTGDATSTSVRSTGSDKLRYRTLPPISLTDINHEAFCSIFEHYLRFVLPYTESKFLHPISAQMRAICQVSIGPIDTQSLILCVAVESILKHVHDAKLSLTSEQLKWIEIAHTYFTDWGGPEDLSQRIKGLFSMLNTTSAKMRLGQLVQLGAITEEQTKAWSQLRNKLAHGEGTGSTPLQDFWNLYNVVLVLFYHIVFYAIRYNGSYTDYSTKGWPTKNYSIPSMGDVTENVL